MHSNRILHQFIAAGVGTGGYLHLGGGECAAAEDHQHYAYPAADHHITVSQRRSRYFLPPLT